MKIVIFYNKKFIAKKKKKKQLKRLPRVISYARYIFKVCIPLIEGVVSCP